MKQNTIGSFTVSFVTFDPGVIGSQVSPSFSKVFTWINKLMYSVLLGEHEIRNEKLRWLIGCY